MGAARAAEFHSPGRQRQLNDNSAHGLSQARWEPGPAAATVLSKGDVDTGGPGAAPGRPRALENPHGTSGPAPRVPLGGKGNSALHPRGESWGCGGGRGGDANPGSPRRPRAQPPVIPGPTWRGGRAGPRRRGRRGPWVRRAGRRPGRPVAMWVWLSSRRPGLRWLGRAPPDFARGVVSTPTYRAPSRGSRRPEPSPGAQPPAGGAWGSARSS